MRDNKLTHIKTKIYSFYRYAYRHIRRNLIYYYLRLFFWFKPTKSKKVYIDCRKLYFNRYLSNLLRYFHDSEYTIYLPNDKILIEKLYYKKGEFAFTNIILSFNVKIGKPKTLDENCNLQLEKLSNDYYSDQRNIFKKYNVPIGKHPEMYISPDPIKSCSKKNIVFFIGNVNDCQYNSSDFQKEWGIPNRYQSFNYAKGINNYFEIKSKNELFEIISFGDKPLLVLIDKFRLNTFDYSQLLSVSRFFLALPGIIVPESHNLLESMEHGVIPIIHEKYARLFCPPLEHNKNSIQYSNLLELEQAINYAFKLDINKANIMKHEVQDYWGRHFQEKSIVRKIISNAYDQICIQAEHVSLDYC